LVEWVKEKGGEEGRPKKRIWGKVSKGGRLKKTHTLMMLSKREKKQKVGKVPHKKGNQGGKD